MKQIYRVFSILLLALLSVLIFACMSAYSAGAAPLPQLTSCGSGSGSELTSGGLVSVSGGTGAASVFDDNVASAWTTTSLPAWVEYTFDTAVKVCVYDLVAISDGATTGPKDWELQANDGSGWVTVESRSGVTFTSSQIRTFNVSASMSANRWRLYVTAVQSGSTLKLGEWRMYESVTPGPTSTPTPTPTGIPTITPTPTTYPYTLYNMKVVGQQTNIWYALILGMLITLAVSVSRKVKDM